MFCPQCRSSWPAGGGEGAVRVDKPKRNSIDASRWGRPLICPNCQIPLAADRIQGEFPSVAHASSTKEGSMTIKDVLRETANPNTVFGEVALDDVKSAQKPRFLGFEIKNYDRIVRAIEAAKSRPPGLLQRMAIISLAMCIGSIVFLSLHAVNVSRNLAKQKAGPAAMSSASGGYSSDQLALLKLMPNQVGGWIRCEPVSALWNDLGSADNTLQTYVSTYRNGSERVELWAIKAPALPNESAVVNFEGQPRAVHTDTAVIDVTPFSFSRARTEFCEFDYTPAHPHDDFWIRSNQPFVPERSHTISWQQGQYVVTAAADTSEERDDFINAGGGQ